MLLGVYLLWQSVEIIKKLSKMPQDAKVQYGYTEFNGPDDTCGYENEIDVDSVYVCDGVVNLDG